tara:strand:+ start:1236 stop:1637 length:402 start_codon:yes stop_codon:yes gene_type:complete
MRSKDVPTNIDEVLSLLGEIDIIKSAMGSFDKSVNIALASDEVSDMIGPQGHFYILKKMEMVQAAVFSLNVELLSIAEKLAGDAVEEEVEKMEEQFEEPKPVKKLNKQGQQNPLVNNVLDYLNERLTTDDGEE